MKTQHSKNLLSHSVCSALLMLLLIGILPSQNLEAQSTYVTFPVAAGFSDIIGHQLVRTNDDRIYVAASKTEFTTKLAVYWTTQPGLPTGNTFTGALEIDVGSEPISVDSVYDGANIIHILVNTRAGGFFDYPFNVRNNTVQPRIQIATNVGSVPADYEGTMGISGMFDTTGIFHTVYWRNDNHIIYQSFTYNSVNNVLQPTAIALQLDSSTKANHPALAISPVDNTLTVAWVSELPGPTKILARTRSTSGVWGAEETVSSSSVWTSTNFGLNIDQGPSIVIDGAGTKHLSYIEDYDNTGDYGRVHYVRRTATDTSWTDTALSTYSHAPVVAINSANEVYIIGHGPTLTRQNDDMYVSKRNADGSWTPIDLFAAHTGTDSLDGGASVKWSVVGWNRPETIEVLFFSAVGGNYSNTMLYYGRIGSGVSSPTNTPTSTTVPGASPTPSFTPTSTATNTPSFTPTLTPSNTPVATASPSSGTQTVTFQINNGADDVNDSGTLSSSDSTIWVGNLGSANPAIAAFRFNNITVPTGATINSAHLEFYSSQQQWISYAVQIAAEAADNSAGFSTSNTPAQRTITTATVSHSSNTSWSAGVWYAFDEMAPVIQQVTNRTGWRSGNSLSVILRGSNTGSFGRKFVNAFESNPATAARLVISFTSSGGNPLPTATYTNTPVPSVVPSNTPGPTNTPTFTPTNTPIPTGTNLPTNTPTFTPTNTPTPTATASSSSGAQSLTVQINNGADDVNDSGTLSLSDSTIWVGNLGSANPAIAAFRFNNITVPTGATINSAHLEFYSSQQQWISYAVQIAAEAADNSAGFSTSNTPAQRTITTATVSHSSNTSWSAGVWYAFDEMAPVIQQVTNRTGWRSGNSLSVILRGSNTGSFGRKFVNAFETNPATAARLVISFTSSGGNPLPTATYTNTPAPSAVPSSTPRPTSTLPFTPTFTPTNTPTATATTSSGTQTVAFAIKSAADDVNEDGTTLTANSATVWIGSSANVSTSLTGLRFTGVTIPRGATILSAHIEVYSPQQQWIAINFQAAADASDNSLAFSTTSKPSQRILTSSRVNHTSNANWLANTWYSLDEIKPLIQEIVSRAGWQSGNSLSLILKASGTATYARKFGRAFDGNSTQAIRLVVTYSG